MSFPAGSGYSYAMTEKQMDLLNEEAKRAWRERLLEPYRSIFVEPKVITPAGSALNAIRHLKGYYFGGLVKKTGKAILHKGEMVVPKKKVPQVKKALKKAGVKPY